MKIIDAARRGLKSLSRAYSGGHIMPWTIGDINSDRDWSRDAGLRYSNGIVFSAIQYASDKLTEVDIYVRRRSANGDWTEVPNHPITELLNAPNPWYDGATLMSGWVISELAGRGGMSFTYKHRSPAGKLVALEYLPHFAVKPFWRPNSGSFIDGYQISTAAGKVDIPAEDILTQRYGPINPLMPQVSIGPLEAVLREVVTDDQAAAYTAALLFNCGVTPHLISPAVPAEDVDSVVFGKTQLEEIETVWAEKISGDKRGKPLVIPIPVKVDNLSIDPASMNLEAIRNISEERVCSALRIPPYALGLGSGLDASTNRATAEAVALAAARDFVKPYMKKKARQLTRDLIPELGAEGEEVAFRIEDIEALQEDKTEEATRDKTACGGPWESVNEVRKRRGLPPVPGGDEIRSNASAKDDEDNKDTNRSNDRNR